MGGLMYGEVGPQGPDGLRYGHFAPKACLCLSPGVLTILTPPQSWL